MKDAIGRAKNALREAVASIKVNFHGLPAARSHAKRSFSGKRVQVRRRRAAIPIAE